MILCNNQLVETSYFELKSMPVKPGSRYHDEPADIPRGQGYCVVCGQKTWVQCWGCLLELKDVFPVCPTSVRDCFQKMHEMRNEIWTAEFEPSVLEKSDKILLFTNVKNSWMLKIQKIYVFSRPQTPNYPARLKGKNHKSYKKRNCVIFMTIDFVIYICRLVKRASSSTFSQKG